MPVVAVAGKAVAARRAPPARCSCAASSRGLRPAAQPVPSKSPSVASRLPMSPASGALIAACTEIPLVLAQDDAPLPLFTSTDLLVARTLAFAGIAQGAGDG